MRRFKPETRIQVAQEFMCLVRRLHREGALEALCKGLTDAEEERVIATWAEEPLGFDRAVTLALECAERWQGRKAAKALAAMDKQQGQEGQP
jgi:hypothetical protein